MGNKTHSGPSLATADRLRELVRLIGPRWEVLGLLDAVLYDWEPRLAALVPPIPLTPRQREGLDGAGDFSAGTAHQNGDAVSGPSQAPQTGGLVFGDEPYAGRMAGRKGHRR